MDFLHDIVKLVILGMLIYCINKITDGPAIQLHNRIASNTNIIMQYTSTISYP